ELSTHCTPEMYEMDELSILSIHRWQAATGPATRRPEALSGLHQPSGAWRPSDRQAGQAGLRLQFQPELARDLLQQHRLDRVHRRRSTEVLQRGHAQPLVAAGVDPVERFQV